MGLEQQAIQVARQATSVYRTATSPVRVLPDFIIIGTQKGGTTSLYSYLIEHPYIVSARMKEVHFFERNYQKGISWYRSHFPTTAHKYYAEHILRRNFVTGEGSPEYLFFPHAAEKAAKVLSNAKLIVMLRNPVDRAYSQYRHNISWGFESKTTTFEEAIELEAERTREGRQRAQQDPSYYDVSYQRAAYLARGIYAEQMQRWMQFYPKEQILIIRSEDFYKDPGSIYKETLEFLNVPLVEAKSLKKGYKVYNESKDSVTSPKMDATIRKRLVVYFEEHNDRLYKLLGRNFGWDH